MKKCIIIPDSFKGTISSIEVCNIIAEEIQKQLPDCECVSLPVADGGEGTVDCFLRAMPFGERISVTVKGPYMEETESFYGRFGDLACIEMAAAAGLPMVADRLNPAKTTTYGVGQLIHHAVQNNAKRIVIGLGGSCTNDGGCGCAAALGAVFRNKAGEAFIPTGETLSEIAEIDTSQTQKLLDGVQITAMCDVTNPFLGLNGAAYIYAPQKGADIKMVQELDANLKHLDTMIQQSLLFSSLSEVPGTGAAGGFGAGILAFLGGKLSSGIEAVLDVVGFDQELQDADLVFTGEGRIDGQSLSGKVVSGIAARAKMKKIPVIAVVGAVGEGIEEMYNIGVSAVFSINRTAAPFEVSRLHSKENLASTVADIIRLIRAVA